MSEKILACVVVTSYNHEAFIREALDSILIQKTDFPFKVYLADDCSTDRTRSILDEYITNYSDIFIPVYPDHNLGMIKNMRNVFNKSEGKYIFIMEGDDYWTSPSKMMKMVNVLEDNLLCPMVANRIWVKDEMTKKNYPNVTSLDGIAVKSNSMYYLTTPAIIKCNVVGNFSAMAFRRSSLNALGEGIWEEKLWDWLFCLIMSDLGPIAYLDEPMSVYRLLPTGQWCRKTHEEKMADILAVLPEYNRVLGFKYEQEFAAISPIIKVNVKKTRFSSIIRKYFKPLCPPSLYSYSCKVYKKLT